MRGQLATPARRAATIAGKQRVVTYRQLRDAGFSGGMVDRWVVKGLLHREFRGVYRFGHRAPSAEARYLAAVLACGPGALLSGFAAAWMHGLLRGAPPVSEVTVRARRSHAGIVVRRTACVEGALAAGIPATSVAQTVVDLAARLPMARLAELCHEAHIRHHLPPSSVEAVLRRRPRTPGVSKLRAIFHGDHPLTLSKMERGFVAWLRRNRFPPAQTNRREAEGYVDCRWPEHHVTVELDSFRFHRTRHAWTKDLRRARIARRRGDEHRRYTWADIFEDDAEMRTELAALLPRA